jgi:hypothetical protein
MDYIHSRIFYKLPLLVLLVLSAFFMPNQGRACMCMGKREAENILEYHPSVFIGVLTQIIQSDSLFSITMGSFMAQRYFNFKVLKSRKEQITFPFFRMWAALVLAGSKKLNWGIPFYCLPMSQEIFLK